MVSISIIANLLWTIFSYSWWFILFLILQPIAVSIWLFWRKKLFSKKVPSVLFELKIPREVMKSPKAMEQVLLTIHSLRNSPATLRDIYWDGETPRSFSLEIVSFEGQIHLYVRTPETWKGLIEASLFFILSRH